MPTISNPLAPNTTPARVPVERTVIYRPAGDWTYSHHASITHFGGRYYAIWSNGHEHEDWYGQRVLIAKSEDFAHWTEPQPLIDSLPGHRGELVLTAAGFHQHEGTLVAYAGQYEFDKTDTHLRAITTTDGDNWSPLLDMGVPVNPNHPPQPTSSGRFIIAGNIAFPYTDDPSGLTGWTNTGIYPPTMSGEDNPETFWRVQEEQGWPVAVCEGSFYQMDDDTLRMLLRATGKKEREVLWLTTSADDGATWSTPVETDFTNYDHKFHFGRLPDGRFYCLCTPYPGSRCPLAVCLSEDGDTFDTHYILADEPWVMSRPGRAKGGEYGYPHTALHDGYLCIIVSRQKEGMEVLRAPLKAL
jgi:hypothetical protein